MDTHTAASEVPRSARIVQTVLTPQERRRVRLLAAQADVSMAEFVRRLVIERLAAEPDDAEQVAA